jgi:hypothetical protein
MAKLVGTLAPSQSYNLLSNLVQAKENKDIFEIHLLKEIELTESTKEIILNQVKATGYEVVALEQKVAK